MPYRALPTFRFPDGTCIAQAIHRQGMSVTLDSPALSVVTDLTETRAARVHPDTSLTEAEQTMIHEGVRLLFVVAAMPCVDGIVTATTLHGDEPARQMSRMQRRRDELRVADVMTALTDLDIVDFDSLGRRCVGDLVHTLALTGRRHLLVAERATPTSAARIRGLVSHAQIERQLGMAVPMSEIVTTFADIERELH
jgi:CBS domain-containing protein